MLNLRQDDIFYFDDFILEAKIEKLETLIKNLDENTIATKNFINVDDGEIVWKKGSKLKKSSLYKNLKESSSSWPSLTNVPQGSGAVVGSNLYYNQTSNNMNNLEPNSSLSIGDAIPAPQAACCFIQRNDGKILGVSRKDDPTAMGLPGGKVDPGETPEQAAVRELQEETGLTAIAIKPILTWLPPDEEYETTTYLCDVENLNDIHSSEEGRVKWCDWNELLNGPFSVYNQRLQDELLK